MTDVLSREFAVQFLSRIDEVITAKEQAIVSNYMDSYEAYKYACGEVNGLKRARMEFEDMFGEDDEGET